MDKNRKQKLDSGGKLEIIQAKTAKTLIERAKREVPGFIEHYSKFEEQMTIGGYSQSTLFNYSRAVAKVSLYFKKSLNPHSLF